MAQKSEEQYETSLGSPQPLSQSPSLHPNPGSLSQMIKLTLRTPWRPFLMDSPSGFREASGPHCTEEETEP